jgi:hypothetical protein
MTIFIISILLKYDYNYQVNEDEMGGACSINRRNEYTNVLGKRERKRMFGGFGKDGRNNIKIDPKEI